ncbi:fumarate hydratase C-terminal domain-containing protein [Escherichia coli]
MITLAKGNRSQQVTDACHNTAALTSVASAVRRRYWRSRTSSISECVAYPELGMEAIPGNRSRRFPAFILLDDKVTTSSRQHRQQTVRELH